VIHTTFNLLREHRACEGGYKKLAKTLGGIRKYGKDTPIAFMVILDSNGIDDAVWSLRAVPKEQEAERDRIARLMACDFAEHVLHIFETTRPDDDRPRKAIEVARRYAVGEATEQELDAARDAAWDAARDAARTAAWDAARAAAWDAARDAAWDAARAAAWDAERQAQVEVFKKYLGENNV